MEKINTKFLGQKIDYYEELPSTHKLAKSLPDEKIVDGMVILTDYQTEGVRNTPKKMVSREAVKI